MKHICDAGRTELAGRRRWCQKKVLLWRIEQSIEMQQRVCERVNVYFARPANLASASRLDERPAKQHDQQRISYGCRVGRASYRCLGADRTRRGRGASKRSGCQTLDQNECSPKQSNQWPFARERCAGSRSESIAPRPNAHR